MEYILKKAKRAQADISMGLIEEGRKYLKEQGSDQWQTGYPDRSVILEDIEKERGYLVTDGGAYLAYLCIDFQGEPAYDGLKGQWIGNFPYAVIHRLAVSSSYRGKGLSQTVFSLAEKECLKHSVYSLRADTDVKNTIMQHIFEKNGFRYCGTVWFAGSDKLAYEKLLFRPLCE